MTFAMAGTAAAQPSAAAASPSSTSAPTSAAKQVTAIAPTGKTVGCGGMDNLFTIPRITGVEYLVNEQVLAPNDYLVADYSTTDAVIVTARATTGFALVGTSSWTVTVAAPACTPPTVTAKCGGFTVTNRASYPIGFSWRAPHSSTDDGYYPTIAPGATKTVTTTRSALNYFYAPADDGMQFSIGELTVPQDCATPSPSTTPTTSASVTTKPTTSTTTSSVVTTTGPVIITDGPADGGHLNGRLLLDGLVCSVGAALTGVGLRRRLTR